MRVRRLPADLPKYDPATPFVQFKPTGHVVSLTVAFPPSVNGLFSGGRFSKRRFISKAYKRWRDAAYWEIHLAGFKPILGSFELEIVLERPDARRRDADNYQKAIIDALVKTGVIEDDSLMLKVSTAWGGKGKQAHVTVRGLVPA